MEGHVLFDKSTTEGDYFTSKMERCYGHTRILGVQDVIVEVDVFDGMYHTDRTTYLCGMLLVLRDSLLERHLSAWNFWADPRAPAGDAQPPLLQTV
eukprot:814793-Amphidinium_carterae.1